MRTWVALYVLSSVATTITNQAADLLSSPWRLLYDDVATEAWDISREDTYNARNWKNRGRPLKHIWDDVFREGQDTDWRFRNEHLPPDLKGRNNEASRVMHFGNSDETREVKNRDNVDRTLLRPVYEEFHDLPRETKNWTPKTNSRNEDEDNKPSSRRRHETRDSISGEVPLNIEHEDRLWPQNNDEKLCQTNNWTQEINNKNVDEDNKLKSKQWSETRDSISGDVPLKIFHEHRLWPQNKDEKPSIVNPLEKRNVDQWPDRHSYVQMGNDYWYISDEHPGVAFALSGISLAGPHVGLFGGEWLQNTAIGEIGDDLPWEQKEESGNGPHERPEDFSLNTRKSKLGIEGERTAEEVFTPDHSDHSIC